MKEKTMSALSPYVGGSRELRQEGDVNSQQIAQLKSLPFVSLLELVSEIYQVCPFSLDCCLKCFTQVQ